MYSKYLLCFLVNDQRDAQITFYVFVFIFNSLHVSSGARGGVVVEALRYKPAGREFDSRWSHWNFSVT